MAEGDVKVLFMPSGRRGLFPRGTPLLAAPAADRIDVDTETAGSVQKGGAAWKEPAAA